MVDGIGVGDVGTAVLRDRQHLASEGMVVIVCSIDENNGNLISGPDIISRGFIYMKESEELIDDVKKAASAVLNRFAGKNKRRRNELKSALREEVGRLLYQRTKRNPMVLTVVMEI